ncbi:MULTISPECIES: DinB family protein [Clostridium]|uniref:DinB family protein n=1 Tax=Clostridium botulinum TaxID=1491 RepID=A0ABD7CG04_CLOBO|nr:MULTISPECIES: DinB family protein [Clostridium]KGO15607.1 hypothetical protein NZ45_00985 [Clostridium botulinum]KOY66161.1 hypothetical protein AN649_10160 [Clostridium sporogenes]MDS1006397.1 DinB family protein [Clostridium sporogenes]QRI52007.1 hypothetical protein JQS73_11135 [Clostridium botulinum]
MLGEFLETYKANRQLTYDILNQLSDEELKKTWTRPGLNSFVKNIKEMISVENAFITAIDNEDMSFDNVPDVFDFSGDLNRDKLLDGLKESDERLEKCINNIKGNKVIKWYDISIALETHLTNLIAHEVFHQGMMAMALYQFGIDIPKSWIESWALPQTIK